MIVSKIDGTECDNNLGLSIHLKKYGMSILEYYIKYENFIIPKCVICDKDCGHKNGLNFRGTCGNKNCITLLKKNYAPSEETKNKIRKARIKHLKKTRGKGSAWKRRSEGKMSKGEEKLHDMFEKNGIYKKYTVINEYCEFPYFIDFAFINEKVAVEYDGRCHFNYGIKRVEHDNKKDEELKKRGWRVYRIPYFEFGDFKLGELIDFIGKPEIKENFNTLLKYRDYVTKKPKKYCDCGNEILTKRSEQCVECSHKERRKVDRPPYQQLVKEIEEMGYKGTGRKYGVSDNAIRKWLKNYN